MSITRPASDATPTQPGRSHAGADPTDDGGVRYSAFHDAADGTRIHVDFTTAHAEQQDELFDLVRAATRQAVRDYNALRAQATTRKA